MNTTEAWQPYTKVFTPDDDDIETVFFLIDGLECCDIRAIGENRDAAMLIADSAIAKILTR